MTKTICRLLIVDDDVNFARENAAICVELEQDGSLGPSLSVEISICNNAYFVKKELEGSIRGDARCRWDVIVADVFMPEPLRRPNTEPQVEVAVQSLEIKGKAVSLYYYEYTFNRDDTQPKHGGFVIAEALSVLRSSDAKSSAIRLALISGQLTGSELDDLSRWTSDPDHWCAYHNKADWASTSSNHALAPHLYRMAIRNAILDWSTPRHYGSSSDPRIDWPLFGSSSRLQEAKLRLRMLLDLSSWHWVVIVGPIGVGRETLVRNVLGDSASVVTLSMRDLKPGDWNVSQEMTIFRDLRFMSPVIAQEVERSLGDLRQDRRYAFICDKLVDIPQFLSRAPERVVVVSGLQERRDDIVTIAQCYATRLRKNTRFTKKACAWLRSRQWLGQTAELTTLVSNAVKLTYASSLDVEILEAAAKEPAYQTTTIPAPEAPRRVRVPRERGVGAIEDAARCCVTAAVAFRQLDAPTGASDGLFTSCIKARLDYGINDDGFLSCVLKRDGTPGASKRHLRNKMWVLEQTRGQWKGIVRSAPFLQPIIPDAASLSDTEWEQRLVNEITSCLGTLESKGYQAQKHKSGS